MILYRPLGEKECNKIAQARFRSFPPRLVGQSFFYPVLNFEYAEQIARDWNAVNGNMGYVSKFEIDDDFISRYETNIVGDSTHQEYWIPAKELDEFNKNIKGKILIITCYRS